MDLILVNCVNRNYNGSIDRYPQLGLVYIATAAQKHGFHTQIAAGEQLHDTLAGLLATSPSALVGFYVNSDNQIEVMRLIQEAKRESALAWTIAGGPVANVAAEELLACRELDFIGRGDGEFLIVELLEKLREQAEQSLTYPQVGNILGLTYRDPDGHVVRNQDRPPLLDLDLYSAPDRSLYPEQHPAITSHIVTSRGCGFKCTFCFESTNRRYRAHSPQRVIDEMLQLKEQYGTTYFSFVDDVFTQNPTRLEVLCDLMLKNFKPHTDLFWYCESRVDMLDRQRQLLPMMKEAGLTRIQIGTESGSQAVIDAYKKAITVEQIYSAVEQIEKCKVLSVYTNLIIGGALETEKTFAETLGMVERLYHLAPGRFECGNSFLSPYPGTDIAMHPDTYEVRVIDPEFVTGLSDDYIFCETYSLRKERILEMQTELISLVARCMSEITPHLEPSLVLQHLRMKKSNLLTDWAQVLSQDPILAAFGRFMSTRHYLSYMDPEDAASAEAIPMRTFNTGSVRQDVLHWEVPSCTVEFSAFEKVLVEMCAGKLTVKELVDRANRSPLRPGGGCTVPEVIEYLNSLAGEMLLVYRRRSLEPSPGIAVEAVNGLGAATSNSPARARPLVGDLGVLRVLA
jgi:radical SAM superfamily enzyme YgiQ (UPF0313 family)